MVEIKRTAKFILKSRNGHNIIRFRVTLHRQRPVDFSTGFDVDLAAFDGVSQRVRSTYPDAGRMNATMDSWRQTADDIFRRFEYVERRVPTPDEFRDLFNDEIGRQTPLKRTLDSLPSETDDFFDVFDRFTDVMSRQNGWTNGTLEKFNALRQHIKDFDAGFSFVTLDTDTMQRYLESLQRKGLRNTTIARNLGFFKWFIRWCANNGYYNGKVHDTFRPRLKGIKVDDKEIIYLTLDELDRLEKKRFPPARSGMEHVRDVFLFCCFTSLRYSDAAKLRRSDIHDDGLHVVTKKTSDALVIPLNNHSRAILDKYRDQAFKNDLALPVISNVKMNVYLKTLCQECGIDEPVRIVWFTGNVRHENVFPKYELITTHAARRTFVVTALRLGIPAEIIMKFTGHSSFAAMKPYIAIVNELKEKAMERFNDI